MKIRDSVGNGGGNPIEVTDRRKVKAMPRRKRQPQFVVEAGEPTAVILDIREYEQMLQRLEEIDDLAVLREMRKKPLKLRPLEEFLKEYNPRV